MNEIKTKICKGCGIEKELNYFYVNNSKKDKLSNKCKECHKKNYENNKEKIKEQTKKYRKENSKKIKKNSQIYYEKNKEKIQEYCLLHKEEIKEYKHKYYEDNKEKIQEQQLIYYISNKDNILQHNKEYRQTDVAKKQASKRNKNRRKNDLAFRLRTGISATIATILKNVLSSKKGKSCNNYLEFNSNELIEHLEKQFEPWMTKDNYGIYDPETWDNNDPLTWVWNIDHIIPQSDLPYTSMEDENFKKCWSLENLRPYSAKQNLLDGISKIRHKKEYNGNND